MQGTQIEHADERRRAVVARHPNVVLIGCLLVACGPAAQDQPDGPNPNPADAACRTAITGTVYAPNGTLPLYNVNVYVPAGPAQPFHEGVSCEQCTAVPENFTITRSKPDGTFRLENVPAGTNIPLTIQIGKWRRQFTVPMVESCVDTPIPDNTLKLPANRTQGDMPRIAVVTGGCDGLACILPKMGIDVSEFGSSSAGPQRIVFYNGAGGSAPGAPKNAPMLWNDLDELKKFDIVINSCECSENNQNKTAPDVLRQYADLGGRVFGSHYHYTWERTLVPQWQSTAQWNGSGARETPDLVDMSFDKGNALAHWLVAIDATAVLGSVALGAKSHDVGPTIPPTARWLMASGTNPTTYFLSFQTPVGTPAEQQCGKVVHANMHVSQGNRVDTTFPQGCAAFSSDEKTLVFLLFDLSSCISLL